MLIDVLIFSSAKNHDLAKNVVATSKKYFYTRLFLYLSQYDTYILQVAMYYSAYFFAGINSTIDTNKVRCGGNFFAKNQILF